MKITHQHFFADVYGKLQWSRRQLPSANVNFMGCVKHISFLVGQYFGPFVNNDIWNLVRWRFDKLMILGCIFSCGLLLVSHPSFFVFCQFFGNLFGHYEFVLYRGMFCLNYFQNFCWYHWLQCSAVVKFDEKICITPSQFQENICLFHKLSSYLIL